MERHVDRRARVEGQARPHGRAWLPRRSSLDHLRVGFEDAGRGDQLRGHQGCIRADPP